MVLLIVATAVSAGLWLHEGDATLPYEAIAIFGIVLLNAVIGYIQQARAEHALAALRQLSAAHAKVIWDRARRTVLAAALVPGDRTRRHYPGRCASGRMDGAANGRGNFTLPGDLLNRGKKRRTTCSLPKSQSGKIRLHRFLTMKAD